MQRSRGRSPPRRAESPARRGRTAAVMSRIVQALVTEAAKFYKGCLRPSRGLTGGSENQPPYTSTPPPTLAKSEPSPKRLTSSSHGREIDSGGPRILSPPHSPLPCSLLDFEIAVGEEAPATPESTETPAEPTIRHPATSVKRSGSKTGKGNFRQKVSKVDSEDFEKIGD